jgi:hypothetical protein
VRKFCGLFSAAGFDRFINERRSCRCLRGQVVPSTPSLWSRVAWRSTPGNKGLLLHRMWQGGRPIVSAANGYSHGGRGDEWRVTRSSHARGSSMQRGRPLVLQHRSTGTSCIHSRLALKGKGKESLPAHP